MSSISEHGKTKEDVLVAALTKGFDKLTFVGNAMQYIELPGIELTAEGIKPLALNLKAASDSDTYYFEDYKCEVTYKDNNGRHSDIKKLSGTVVFGTDDKGNPTIVELKDLCLSHINR